MSLARNPALSWPWLCREWLPCDLEHQPGCAARQDQGAGGLMPCTQLCSSDVRCEEEQWKSSGKRFPSCIIKYYEVGYSHLFSLWINPFWEEPTVEEQQHSLLLRAWRVEQRIRYFDASQDRISESHSAELHQQCGKTCFTSNNVDKMHINLFTVPWLYRLGNLEQLEVCMCKLATGVLSNL